MKKFKYIFPILFLISACGGLSDAKKVLKNEKVITTDEFLVKKKEPLILPPEFDKLPVRCENRRRHRREFITLQN